MLTTDNDNADAVVAFLSGAIIGVAATLLLVRLQFRRNGGSRADYDEYGYDGGDIFI